MRGEPYYDRHISLFMNSPSSQVIDFSSKIMSPDGKNKGILFGDLFNIYNSISNKVCSMYLYLLLLKKRQRDFL